MGQVEVGVSSEPVRTVPRGSGRGPALAGTAPRTGGEGLTSLSWAIDAHLASWARRLLSPPPPNRRCPRPAAGGLPPSPPPSSWARSYGDGTSEREGDDERTHRPPKPLRRSTHRLTANRRGVGAGLQGETPGYRNVRGGAHTHTHTCTRTRATLP